MDGIIHLFLTNQSVHAGPHSIREHTHTHMFPVYMLSSSYYKQVSTSAHGGNAPREFPVGLAFSFSLP